MQDGGLRIAVHRQTPAEVAAEMEITPAFLEGDEGIELAIATALEDGAAAGRDVEGEAGGEDEICGLIVDERVFQTCGEIHPAIWIREGVVVHVHVAVLRGDEGQTVRQRIAELQRVELRVTAAEEGIVDAVMHKDRADLRADLRVLKENRIRHRGDGALLPRRGLDAGRWRGRCAGIGIDDERNGGAGSETDAAQPPRGVCLWVHANMKACTPSL